MSELSPFRNNDPYHSDLIKDAKEKEETVEIKSITVASPFEIMDRLDDQQIVDSIKGKVIDTFVYSYTDSSGKVIEGLSKTGVDESCKQLANKGEVIRELECDMEAQDDSYACFKAKAGRFAINTEGKEVLLETKIGHKRQCKYVIGKGGIPNKEKPNSFWYEQGGQKALRNCRRDLLSEGFIVELIKKWKAAGKVQKIQPQDIQNGETTAAKPFTPQGDLSGVMPIGKYKGMSFEEIYAKDKSYLEWMVTGERTAETLKASLEIFLDSKRNMDNDDLRAEIGE